MGSLRVSLDRPAATSPPRVARGAAYADTVSDGDLVLLFTTNAGPALLFRNNNCGTNHSLWVKLVRRKSNRDRIGAIVRDRTGSDQPWQMMRSGFS